MGYSISISESAEDDIRTSYLWYEDQQSGLGERFKTEINLAIKTIQTNPLLYPKKFADTQVCLTPDFPFGIHFKMYHDLRKIIIVAVFHTSRNPEIWINRLK